MDSPLLAESTVRFEGEGDNIVEKIIYSDERVYINKNQYFTHIPRSVWEFFIG